MSLAKVNGVDLIEARVKLPPRGAWTAELAVDLDNAAQAAGKVVIDLGGPLQLQGVAIRGGTAAGVTKLRVMGGAGGMSLALTPKDYRHVPLRTVIQDALSEAGEMLSPASSSDVLALQLPRWTRFAQRTTELVTALAARAGCSWRVLYDGTTWLGMDTWAAATVPYDLLRGDPHLGSVEIGVETPFLVPGVSFLGQRVAHVEHVLATNRIRSVVTFA